jgi:hypothetical protein
MDRVWIEAAANQFADYGKSEHGPLRHARAQGNHYAITRRNDLIKRGVIERLPQGFGNGGRKVAQRLATRNTALIAGSLPVGTEFQARIDSVTDRLHRQRGACGFGQLWDWVKREACGVLWFERSTKPR